MESEESTDEVIFRAAMEKQTYGHSEGEEGEGESIRRVTEIYNTICKIDSQWEFAV